MLDTVKPKGRSSVVRTHVPPLVDLYRDGSATVQVLGLQRVGFNQALFDILCRASKKRERVAAMFQSLSESSGAGGAAQVTPRKRGLSEAEDDATVEAEIDGNADDWDGDRPGPSKIVRVGEVMGPEDLTPPRWDV